MKENEIAALVKRACRVCHTLVDGEILLSALYNEKGESKIDLSKVQGKTIGYIEDTGKCDDCIETTKGYITLLGINPEKSDRDSAHLTGHRGLVKFDSDFGKYLLKDFKDKILGDNILYVEDEVLTKLKEKVDGM